MLRLFTPMTTIALISSATIISTGIIAGSIKDFIKRRKGDIKVEILDDYEAYDTSNHYNNYYDSYTSSNSYNSYNSYSNNYSSTVNDVKEISEFSYWNIVRVVEEELRFKTPSEVEEILNQNGFYDNDISDYEAAQKIAEKAQYGNILNPSYFASRIKDKLNNMY